MTIWYEELKDGSIGINTPFKEVAEKLGLTNSTENEVVLNWDGKYYIKGNCPEKPQEIKEQEIRQVRNEYLIETDKFVSIPDFPVSEEEKSKCIEYRKYLRDYPESSEDWYKQNPKTFKEFKGE